MMNNIEKDIKKIQKEHKRIPYEILEKRVRKRNPGLKENLKIDLKDCGILIIRKTDIDFVHPINVIEKIKEAKNMIVIKTTEGVIHRVYKKYMISNHVDPYCYPYNEETATNEFLIEERKTIENTMVM